MDNINDLFAALDRGETLPEFNELCSIVPLSAVLEGIIRKIDSMAAIEFYQLTGENKTEYIEFLRKAAEGSRLASKTAGNTEQSIYMNLLMREMLKNITKGGH